MPAGNTESQLKQWLHCKVWLVLLRSLERQKQTAVLARAVFQMRVSWAQQQQATADKTRVVLVSKQVAKSNAYVQELQTLKIRLENYSRNDPTGTAGDSSCSKCSRLHEKVLRLERRVSNRRDSSVSEKSDSDQLEQLTSKHSQLLADFTNREKQYLKQLQGFEQQLAAAKAEGIENASLLEEQEAELMLLQEKLQAAEQETAVKTAGTDQDLLLDQQERESVLLRQRLTVQGIDKIDSLIEAQERELVVVEEKLLLTSPSSHLPANVEGIDKIDAEGIDKIACRSHSTIDALIEEQEKELVLVQKQLLSSPRYNLPAKAEGSDSIMEELVQSSEQSDSIMEEQKTDLFELRQQLQAAEQKLTAKDDCLEEIDLLLEEQQIELALLRHQLQAAAEIQGSTLVTADQPRSDQSSNDQPQGDQLQQLTLKYSQLDAEHNILEQQLHESQAGAAERQEQHLTQLQGLQQQLVAAKAESQEAEATIDTLMEDQEAELHILRQKLQTTELGLTAAEAGTDAIDLLEEQEGELMLLRQQLQAAEQRLSEVVSELGSMQKVTPSAEKAASQDFPPQRAASPDYEAQVEAIYRKHNPDKLSTVGKLMERHTGREEALLAKLRKKYPDQEAFTKQQAAATERQAATAPRLHRVRTPRAATEQQGAEGAATEQQAAEGVATAQQAAEEGAIEQQAAEEGAVEQQAAQGEAATLRRRLKEMEQQMQQTCKQHTEQMRTGRKIQAMLQNKKESVEQSSTEREKEQSQVIEELQQQLAQARGDTKRTQIRIKLLESADTTDGSRSPKNAAALYALERDDSQQSLASNLSDTETQRLSELKSRYGEILSKSRPNTASSCRSPRSRRSVSSEYGYTDSDDITPTNSTAFVTPRHSKRLAAPGLELPQEIAVGLPTSRGKGILADWGSVDTGMCSPEDDDEVRDFMSEWERGLSPVKRRR